MKILIVSKEVWRDDQNAGHTLTGFFRKFPDNTEYAQIYCSEGIPQNEICHHYYKLTTNMLARQLIHKGNKYEQAGEQNTKKLSGYNDTNCASAHGNSKYSKFTNSEFLRDVVWTFSNYKLNSLRDFIVDFDPDIIFAPGYGVKYMNYLIQWIGSFVECPIVSFVSDDYYSMRAINFNPIFWIRHLVFRNLYKKTVSLYSLIYTPTDTQLDQLKKDFSVPVKILRKGAQIKEFRDKNTSKPIRMVYAGNLFLNRWKTLQMLVKSITAINEMQKEGDAFRLDIYSNTKINDSIKNKLSYKDTCVLHPAVSQAQLKEIYDSCDIAIHAESFDLVNREKVRLSFSTKITDCIASGNAVLCICHKDQGGYRFLAENKAAICIDNPDKILPELKKISKDPRIIDEYRNKAYDLAKNTIDENIISQQLFDDFNKLTSGKNI